MKYSKFQFSNPALINLHFSLNNGFKPAESVNMPVETKVKVKSVTDERKAGVSLQVIIGKNTAEYPFYIIADMNATFRWDEGLDDPTVKLLLNENAPSLLLAYLRPQLALVTGSSPYPTYNLPYIDFTSKEEETATTSAAESSNENKMN